MFRDIPQIPRARRIARTLGYYAAARYLAHREWSIEAALWVLLRTTVRSNFA